MDEQHRQNRREAEKKFKLSLTELEALWQAEEDAQAVPPPPSLPEPRPAPDWESALADAAEDIEQFMADQTPDSGDASPENGQD
jgi:hypothetical protein